MLTKEKLQLNLKAEKREVIGKKNQISRQEGLIPAVLYGNKIDNLNLFVDSQEFGKVFEQAGENTLIDLHVKGKKDGVTVLIYDLQKDPLSGDILHVDFYQPDLSKKVTALVPIKIIGESSAAKNKGGTLVKNANELEVKALPMDLPHELVVDVSALDNFGDEIFVKNIELSEGVEILRDPGDVLMAVVAPTDVDHELDKPIEEKIEDIETIGKDKEGEGEEEAEKTETKKEADTEADESKKEENPSQKKE